LNWARFEMAVNSNVKQFGWLSTTADTSLLNRALKVNSAKLLSTLLISYSSDLVILSNLDLTDSRITLNFLVEYIPTLSLVIFLNQKEVFSSDVIDNFKLLLASIDLRREERESQKATLL